MMHLAFNVDQSIEGNMAIKQGTCWKWEKIFAKDISDKGLLSISKEILKLNNQKPNTPING